MTLDSSELIPGAVIEAAHVIQFYNLLTGVMTDQSVLLKNKLTLTRVAAAAPAPIPYLLVTGIADTAVSGEVQDVFFNFNRTVQIAGASIPASNRSFYVAAPTLASSSVQTLAKAATVAISGPPIAGTNLTLTRTLALELETGDLQLTTGKIYIGTPTLSSGSGSPEASVTAEPGSVYLRTSGTVWKKASGSGNTGWVGVAGMTIKAKYTGAIDVNGVASATATITAVVAANSMLRHLGASSAQTTVPNTMCTLVLTNTTTITAARNGSTGSVLVNYELTEWE